MAATFIAPVLTAAFILLSFFVLASGRRAGRWAGGVAAREEWPAWMHPSRVTNPPSPPRLHLPTPT
jgi:hypothetical protein